MRWPMQPDEFVPQSIPLGIQILDRDVWINNDRLESYGNIHPGISNPYYLADGPIGMCQHKMAANDSYGWLDIQEGSWSTYESPEEIISILRRQRGIQVELPATYLTGEPTMEKVLDFKIGGHELKVTNEKANHGNSNNGGGYCIRATTTPPRYSALFVSEDGSIVPVINFASVFGFPSEEAAIAFAKSVADGTLSMTDVQLKKKLGATLLALLSLPKPPENIKGLVLQKLPKLSPEQKQQMFALDDKEVLAWLLANLASILPAPVTPVPPSIAPLVAAVPVPAPARNYSVEGSYTRSESGRCNFTCTSNYSGSLTWTEEELRDLASECSDREEFIQKLEDQTEENQQFDQDDTSDYSYDGEETDDWEGIENWDSNASVIADRFLDEHPECEPEREEEEEEDDEPAETIHDQEAPTPRAFHVGDCVRATGNYDGAEIAGLEGVVCQEGNPIGVRFDDELDEDHCHSCGGHCEHEHGWNVPTRLLQLLDPPESASVVTDGFQVGQRVRINTTIFRELSGREGTVCGQFASSIGVHLDEPARGDGFTCHDCYGSCPDGEGWYFTPADLAIIPEPVPAN